MARAMLDQGREAIVVEGGLRAWRKHGLPVEPVPPDDIVHLPTFARRKAAAP